MNSVLQVEFKNLENSTASLSNGQSVLETLFRNTLKEYENEVERVIYHHPELIHGLALIYFLQRQYHKALHFSIILFNCLVRSSNHPTSENKNNVLDIQFSTNSKSKLDLQEKRFHHILLFEKVTPLLSHILIQLLLLNYDGNFHPRHILSILDSMYSKYIKIENISVESYLRPSALCLIGLWDNTLKSSDDELEMRKILQSNPSNHHPNVSVQKFFKAFLEFHKLSNHKRAIQTLLSVHVNGQAYQNNLLSAKIKNNLACIALMSEKPHLAQILLESSLKLLKATKVHSMFEILENENFKLVYNQSLALIRMNKYLQAFAILTHKNMISVFGNNNSLFWLHIVECLVGLQFQRHLKFDQLFNTSPCNNNGGKLISLETMIRDKKLMAKKQSLADNSDALEKIMTCIDTGRLIFKRFKFGNQFEKDVLSSIPTIFNNSSSSAEEGTNEITSSITKNIDSLTFAHLLLHKAFLEIMMDKKTDYPHVVLSEKFGSTFTLKRLNRDGQLLHPHLIVLANIYKSYVIHEHEDVRNLLNATKKFVNENITHRNHFCSDVLKSSDECDNREGTKLFSSKDIDMLNFASFAPKFDPYTLSESSVTDMISPRFHHDVAVSDDCKLLNFLLNFNEIVSHINHFDQRDKINHLNSDFLINNYDCCVRKLREMSSSLLKMKSSSTVEKDVHFSMLNMLLDNVRKAQLYLFFLKKLRF